MATYSRREIHTTRVEYLIPAEFASGACWVEVYKAVSAAIQELVTLGLLEKGREPSDDAIRIRPGDDEVIVYFDLDTAYAERVRRSAVEGGVTP